MNDEEKRMDEEVEKTVEDLKKQIEEISREADEASAHQSGETREKIEAAARRAIEILNQSIDQLRLMAAQVQDSEAYRKTMTQIRQGADKAISEAHRLIVEIKNDPKLNRVMEDICKSVNEVGNKVGGCVKDGLDELKENEELMKKVDQIKDGTEALVEKGRSAVRDFTNRPEVHQNIEKAKDVTIDVAEKTVDALKSWLRPAVDPKAEDQNSAEEEKEKENQG